ncbi:MAG: hypothetical protein EOO04_02500 [Chitinophagaceae bacterium]|nr:MAG: hypothetical protein EOO04_02500 [Chitinophagaceae bacterium]
MRTLFFGLCLFISGSLFSQQKFLPTVKSGTKMQYMANVDGQDVPVGFSIDSATADFLKIGWSVEGYGDGTWVMNKKSLESATSSSGENPQPGVEVVLPDDQLMLVLSRQQWKALQDSKKMVHNGTNYVLVPSSSQNELKLGDKSVDVLYVESDNKSSKIWILNNPFLPVMLKVVGNPNGPDLNVLSIN